MNEKIEEFAKQCYVKTGSQHTDHFEYWKFADLIIRECIESIQATSVESVALDRTLMENCRLTVNDIKKYFGV